MSNSLESPETRMDTDFLQFQHSEGGNKGTNTQEGDPMNEAKWPEAQQRVDGELKRLDKETREMKKAIKDVVQEVNDLKVELVGELKGMLAVTKELADNIKAGRARWMTIVMLLVAAILAMVRAAVF